jgi:hypothetical protein
MNERTSTHGGERPKSPAELRSPLLQRHGSDLVTTAIDRLSDSSDLLAAPEVLRAEDLQWHLSFLDAALATGEPSQFLQYAEWVVRFLSTRGVGGPLVAESFDYLADGLGSLPCPVDLEAHRRLQVDTLRKAARMVRKPAD